MLTWNTLVSIENLHRGMLKPYLPKTLITPLNAPTSTVQLLYQQTNGPALFTTALKSTSDIKNSKYRTHNEPAQQTHFAKTRGRTHQLLFLHSFHVLRQSALLTNLLLLHVRHLGQNSLQKIQFLREMVSAGKTPNCKMGEGKLTTIPAQL